MKRMTALIIGFFFAQTSATRADTWILVAKSGEVASTKASGWSWDVWPVTRPEVFLKIRVFDDRGDQVDYGETGYEKGTCYPSWNSAIANVAEGDRIKVEVWDKDVRYDDLIGKSDFYLTRAMVRERRVVLRFGQVRELFFELRPATGK